VAGSWNEARREPEEVPLTAPAGEPTGLIDLAARRLGGMVVAAGDEFFAAKENLLEPRPPVFDPDRYSDRGKEMDGWETRRRRGPGHDWCIVRLGVPGVVRVVVVDTTHFRGNHPEAFSLEGTVAGVLTSPQDLAGGQWFPLMERTGLEADLAQRFEVGRAWRATHVRLNIHPDGGVARLRLLGEPLVALATVVGAGGRLDLAAITSGGAVTGCSDAFFSSPGNLITVGDARDMADGWETRRKRGGGHDWVTVRLATGGVVERVEVDTTHFKGNHPDRCALDAADVAGGRTEPGERDWHEVVPPSPLAPHHRHTFEVPEGRPATHVRLRILPDGGVARLRVFGRVTDEGWRAAGLRQLNALAPAEAAGVLAACCASRAWAAGVADRRPFADEAGLQAAADEVWSSLGPDDWREAIAAHPRIGERGEAGRRAGRWSAVEQAGAGEAGDTTPEALAEGNRAYEQRFGHVFLIRASGRSAGEMLAALRERLGNEPEAELRVAAAEQRDITRLRLGKLLAEGGVP
jgi:allantoicase